jgi:tetratricopeptide (TPR) repeat protein
MACLGGLAAAYHNGRQYETSARLFEQLLGKQRTICSPTHQDTLGTMHNLAMVYGNMGRLAESMALHEKFLDAVKSKSDSENESAIWPRMTLAQVCQRAGELDRADQLLREALAQIQKNQTSQGERKNRSNALGWLALNMHLQHRDAEAEGLIRQTLAFHRKELPESARTFYWESVLGAVLLGQQRYAEAETQLLQGYEGMKRRQATDNAGEIEFVQAGERVVRFYEETNQPEKAREWREKIGVRAESKLPPETKEAQPELLPLPREVRSLGNRQS